jgi:ABC-type Na+ transport system ATPase subunit NatA
VKQDDYLLNQIDLLGKVLAKIIAQLLKRKTNNEIFEVSEVTIQISEKEAPITIAELLELSNDKLIEFLISHQFHLNHFEKMGELFHLLSNKSTHRLNCLNKSLTLYNYVHTHSTTYSTERVNRIRKIEEKIIRNDLP